MADINMSVSIEEQKKASAERLRKARENKSV